jgi:hypothetical protein
MKKMSHFARRILGGALLLALTATAIRAGAESIPQGLTVTYIKGSARYSTDNKTWHALKKGDVLPPGCLIQTADKSTVDVLLGDRVNTGGASTISASSAASPLAGGGGGGGGGSAGMKSNIIRIMENSFLGVDKLLVEKTGVDSVSETQLDLRAGQILGNVKKLSASSKYEIKIPNGVAGIRGTTYLISSSGTVEVLTGSVVVAVVAADGSVTTVVVTAGNRYNPASGKIEPIPPEVLKKLEELYHDLHGNNPTPPTSYPKDHTIIYVSPN